MFDKPEVEATTVTDEDKKENEFVVSIKREQEQEFQEQKTQEERQIERETNVEPTQDSLF